MPNYFLDISYHIATKISVCKDVWMLISQKLYQHEIAFGLTLRVREVR
jgi:hypothetical protein